MRTMKFGGSGSSFDALDENEQNFEPIYKQDQYHSIDEI